MELQFCEHVLLFEHGAELKYNKKKRKKKNLFYSDAQRNGLFNLTPLHFAAR